MLGVCRGRSTSSRESKHQSRFFVQAFKRQNRLGPQCNIFRAINLTWGPLQVDLFATRFSAQLRRFFSWGCGSQGGGNRHLFSELVHEMGICTLSMVPNCKGTDEGSEGRSNSHSGRSTVEEPTLVPFSPEHVGGSTNSITRHPRSDHSFPKLLLETQLLLVA